MKLDKLLRPFRPHKETSYPLYSIYMAYTKDGSFMKPFAYSNDKKETFSDMETGKMVDIPKNPVELAKIIKDLYGIDNLETEYLRDFIGETFDYGEKVPGFPFTKLEFERFLKMFDLETDPLMGDTQVIYDGNWMDWNATYSQLKPLMKFAQNRIKENYECECTNQKQSL